MSIPTRDELIERLRAALWFHPHWLNDEERESVLADFALVEIRRAVREELESLRELAERSTLAPGTTYEGDTMNFGGAEGLRGSAQELRAASAPKLVDVFERFNEKEQITVRTWADSARDWFGSIVAYVQTMAARPCVQPGKDCGFCDSCEARLDVAELRRKAQEASR